MLTLIQIQMDVLRCLDEMKRLYNMLPTVTDALELEEVPVEPQRRGLVKRDDDDWLRLPDIQRSALTPGRQPYSFDWRKTLDGVRKSVGQVFEDYNFDNQLAKSVRRGRSRISTGRDVIYDDRSNPQAMVE